MRFDLLKRPATLALLACAAFVGLTCWLTWTEHQTYNSTSLDLAVYRQLLWNLGQGRSFETTLLLQNRLHLSEHLALLLLPLTPVYALWPALELPLGLQQLALGLSGGVLYWLARRHLPPMAALLILAGYLVMPTLTEVALDALYPIAFAALPIGLAAALAVERRPRAAALLALLALLWEEEAALAGLGLGAYLLLQPSARRVGAALVLVAGLWLGVAEALLMPRYATPGAAADGSRVEGHFGELRSNPLAWLRLVALDRLEPELFRESGFPGGGRPSACQQAGQCSALRWWLYPTAGLALASPTTLLIAGPPAAALLLADKPGRFRRHWAAPILPVIWIASALGLARLGRWPTGRLAGAALLVIASTTFYRLDGSLPGGSQFEADDLVLAPLGDDLRRQAAEIWGGASLMASRRGLAHHANRTELYAFPPKDYSPGLWPPPELPRFALLDLRNGDTARELQVSSGVIQTGGYRERARTANALLLERATR